MENVLRYRNRTILFYALFIGSILILYSFIALCAVFGWTTRVLFANLTWFLYAYLAILFSPLCFIFLVFAIINQIRYAKSEKNRAEKHRIKRKTILVFACVVVPIIAGLGAYSGTLIFNHIEEITYTREKWLSGSNDDRGRIVDDFVAKYDLLSFDKTEVEYYLGEPDTQDDYSYVYDVGYGRAKFQIDPASLYISFDGQDNVIHYSVFEN